MQSNIKKDYLWNTLGVFLQNAISPLLLIVITRVNGIHDSGLFSFAFALAIIFWGIGMWGGRTFQVSDLRSEFSHRGYIAARLVLGGVMLVGAVIFSQLNSYDATKTLIIITLVSLKIVESVADSLYGIMQANDKLFLSGKSLTYKALIGFALFACIDVFTKDILLSSLGMLFANVAVVGLYDIPAIRKLESNLKLTWVNMHESFNVVKQTAPIFVTSFLTMFSLNTPRYFIDLYHQKEIGYFGILAMPVTLIVLLMTFILQPSIITLSRLFDKKQYKRFTKTVTKIVTVTLGIGLGVLGAAFLIGVPVLNLLFGVSFSDYQLILMVMIAGGVANSIVAIYINILTIMRHFRAQFYILFLTNIVLIISSPFIIKPGGLGGGAWLFTCTSLLQAILLAAVYIYILRKVRNAEKN